MKNSVPFHPHPNTLFFPIKFSFLLLNKNFGMLYEFAFGSWAEGKEAPIALLFK
jgi:hypothetical protein